MKKYKTTIYEIKNIEKLLQNNCFLDNSLLKYLIYIKTIIKKIENKTISLKSFTKSTGYLNIKEILKQTNPKEIELIEIISGKPINFSNKEEKERIYNLINESKKDTINIDKILSQIIFQISEYNEKTLSDQTIEMLNELAKVRDIENMAKMLRISFKEAEKIFGQDIILNINDKTKKVEEFFIAKKMVDLGIKTLMLR